MADPASITLSPCPFCGSDEISFGTFNFGDRERAYVKCEDCDCAAQGHDTEAEAIAAWNKRPALARPARAQAGVAELVAVVRACGEQFRSYQEQHRAKGTLDGDVKAITNARFADMCADSLAALNGGEDG